MVNYIGFVWLIIPHPRLIAIRECEHWLLAYPSVPRAPGKIGITLTLLPPPLIAAADVARAKALRDDAFKVHPARVTEDGGTRPSPTNCTVAFLSSG